MASKRRGRQNPPQRRHLRVVPERAESSAQDQELFLGLRTAMRSDHPIDLLMLVGGMLSVTDPRAADPFDQQTRPTLDDLVDSFIGTPYAETTTALAVLRELVADDLVRARIVAELARRRHPLASWLSQPDLVELDPEVWELTHVLGDGDDYFFGISLPGNHQLTALVYVDHNLGTVVKDAFLVPQSVAAVVETTAQHVDAPDQLLQRCDPAQARAIMTEAIEHGARMFPPLKSDSWPICRSVVEWMARLLPTGGEVPERPSWSQQEQAKLAADFFASAYGIEHDRADCHELLDSVLWFGSDYGPGDPLRWSPVNVEMLLMDWFPRKIVADAVFLAQLPDLLRGFIRYAHHRRGIRATLTRETLAAVDRWEPDYQQLIHSARPQGAAALLATMLGESSAAEVDLPTVLLAELADLVGGPQALDRLDAQPLPDEPFDWSGIPDDIRPTVEATLTRCDACADEMFDVEHRTAMRRFLSRAAQSAPAVFRRRASVDRGAAAVAWVIGRSNQSVSMYGKITSQGLFSWFGVSGSVSQRAEPLLRANGVDPFTFTGSEPVLGDPTLLVADRRADILHACDRWRSSGLLPD